MNNLANNIEYLLLSRNCVIVPGLGGFYAIDTPSRWIGVEDVFLPPVRHIRFDSTVTTDSDDFFIRSLAEIYGWTIEVARKRCQKMVEEFHKTLILEESIDFGSIGVFSIEDDAEIVLNSCECGVITPDYYGLDTLPFVNIKPEERVMKVQKTIMEIIPEQIIPSASDSQPSADKSKTGTHEKDDSHYTIRISKSAVNYAMAVAATIALFFVMRPATTTPNQPLQQMARPVMFLQPEMIKQDAPTAVLQTVEDDAELLSLTDEDTNIDDLGGVLIDVTDEIENESTTAEPTPAEKVEAPVAKPTETKAPVAKAETKAPVAKPVETKVPVAKPVETKAPVAKPVETKTTSTGSTYCIVLASGVSKPNAEVYVSKLAKDNIRASIIEGDLRRVVIDGFATYEAAHQHMATLKATGNCLDAWVLKK